MTHEYGDAPVEQSYRMLMQAVATTLDGFFNGKAKGKDRQTGFILLVFPFGEGDDLARRANYISNGASRKQVMVLLREQADRFEADLKARGEL